MVYQLTAERLYSKVPKIVQASFVKGAGRTRVVGRECGTCFDIADVLNDATVNEYVISFASVQVDRSRKNSF